MREGCRDGKDAEGLGLATAERPISVSLMTTASTVGMYPLSSRR